MQAKITPHETFVVHELLMSKTLCANKSAMWAAMVTDPDLRGWIQNSLNQDKQQITDLKGFIGNSQINEQGGTWSNTNYNA
jgi:similar to spore coat protein